MIQAGELVVNWSYSTRHYEQQTIKHLAEDYVSNLQLLINHCLEQARSGVVYTPSDYGLPAEITYKQLDHFLAQQIEGKKRGELLEGLYCLSGLQQGMLFHSLYDGRVEAYIEQFSCELLGFKQNVFTQSWQYVLKRHSILRSGLYYKEFSVPVQCVYKEVELPIEVLDYREMSEEQQRVAIKQYKEQDRAKGFDFTVAPLMRITLMRLSEEHYHMLWTYHHILLDGWSMHVLIEEFLSTYESLVLAKEVIIGEEDRYEDYIRYVERRDQEQEQLYWPWKG
jgi:hypothetical protein